MGGGGHAWVMQSGVEAEEKGGHPGMSNTDESTLCFQIGLPLKEHQNLSQVKSSFNPLRAKGLFNPFKVLTL